jgi:hypothetical protein
MKPTFFHTHCTPDSKFKVMKKTSLTAMGISGIPEFVILAVIHL